MPSGSVAEPDDSITDEELAKYATGRVLLSVLRLRRVYYQLQRDRNGRIAVSASAVMRELAPDQPELPTRVRESVLRISGYQVWGDVQRSWELVDKALIFAFGVILTGIVGGAVFYADGSFWHRIGFAGIALLPAGVVFVLFGAATDARRPTSPAARTMIGVLGLSLATMVGVLVSQWQSLWGFGLSTGIFVAVASLLTVGVLAQIGRVLLRAAFRVSWSRWTADELTQTLAATHWVLTNDPEPGCLRFAAYYLDHAAYCVRRFLPGHLTMHFSPESSVSLPHGAQREFAEIAAGFHALAKECLLPKSATRASVTGKVARLMVAVAQEKWGDLDRTDVDEVERAARWRLWIFAVLRFGLGLLPFVLASLAALYLFKTNPSSPLLKAEVLAPVLVATFGFFTAVLTAKPERAGEDRKPFRDRRRS